MGGPGPTGRPYPTALECRAVDAPTGGGQGQARARARARAEGEAWPTPRTWRCYWSAPGCAPGGGAVARPIRGTRGQRVENPRWTERWRGVLRHVPQRTVQRTPCVPLALSGYGCELRSCTSTARRPYGIPTRTVWYCVGRWSRVRREEAGRGPACGAAHRRTPVEGSRHVRVRRPVPPTACNASALCTLKEQHCSRNAPPQVPLTAYKPACASSLKADPDAAERPLAPHSALCRFCLDCCGAPAFPPRRRLRCFPCFAVAALAPAPSAPPSSAIEASAAVP